MLLKGYKAKLAKVELMYEVYKTDEQWKSELNEFEYHVLRMAGTERAYTGELLDEKRAGSYHCRGCDAFLFEAETKFDSHCGWPSFYKPQDNDAIEYIEDRAHGTTLLSRLEGDAHRVDAVAISGWSLWGVFENVT